MRILLIEGEPIIQFYMKTSLASLSHEVICTASGEEALFLLKQDFNYFDSIIMESNIRDMNAFQLIDIIHEQTTKPKILIVVPYIGRDAQLLHEYKNKIRGFIKKPIDIAQLINVVRSFENNYDSDYVN